MNLRVQPVARNEHRCRNLLVEPIRSTPEWHGTPRDAPRCQRDTTSRHETTRRDATGRHKSPRDASEMPWGRPWAQRFVPRGSRDRSVIDFGSGGLASDRFSIDLSDDFRSILQASWTVNGITHYGNAHRHTRCEAKGSTERKRPALQVDRPCST